MCEVCSTASPIQKSCLFFTCCQKREKKSSQQFEPTLCKIISKLGNKFASSYYVKLLNDKKSTINDGLFSQQIILQVMSMLNIMNMFNSKIDHMHHKQ